jgi:hypothetical protein
LPGFLLPENEANLAWEHIPTRRASGPLGRLLPSCLALAGGVPSLLAALSIASAVVACKRIQGYRLHRLRLGGRRKTETPHCPVLTGARAEPRIGEIEVDFKMVKEVPLCYVVFVSSFS